MGRNTPNSKGNVVLVHGVASSPIFFSKMENALRKEGYRVLSVSYPSTKARVEILAEQVFAQIFSKKGEGPIHIVTHSMGGILLRQYLKTNGIPHRLGRVVMISPPNAGSQIVDKIGDWWLFGKIMGPAARQLGAEENSLPRRLGPFPDGIELGIIAGNFSFEPHFSAMLPGDDDGKVTVASTHLNGEKEHITLDYSHTFILRRKVTIEAVSRFLEYGSFKTGSTELEK